MGSAAPSTDAPLVLIKHKKNRQIIVAVDQAARKLGISPDMTIAKASTRAVGLHIEPADPEGDMAALEQLAQWALKRYSPFVGIDAPQRLLIDATGATDVFGNEQAMLSDIVGQLHAAGFTACAAIAPTYAAAYALTHTMNSPTMAVCDAECEIVINALPVAALRLPSESVAGLIKAGIKTIGELKNKPRTPLLERFGQEIGRRLDQLSGQANEVIEPVTPIDPFIVKRAFLEPISTPESIAWYVKLQVEKLCAMLETKRMGIRCLDLLCYYTDSQFKTIRLNLPKPVRDVKKLMRLLCDKLGAVPAGTAIDRMSLSATWIEAVEYKDRIERAVVTAPAAF